MLRPKKNSYKEFDDEKKFLRLENSPPPPHNFSNGPSLNATNANIVTQQRYRRPTRYQRMPKTPETKAPSH